MIKNLPIVQIKNLITISQTREQGKNLPLIVKGLDLQIDNSEIQIVMGPNGSGKSTLAKVLAGHPAYQLVHGTIKFRRRNLLDCLPETRAKLGLFLAFQYPIEVSGVSNQDFLRLAYSSRYSKKKEETNYGFRFATRILDYVKILEMDPAFLPRPLNQGFSGGEKKKNEILQMAIAECQLSILDEIDSGLDVDALKALSKTILIYFLNDLFLNPALLTQKSLLLITHYRRLLEYIQPNKIQIMRSGKIVCSGDYRLGLIVDRKGYDWLFGIGLGSSLRFSLNKRKLFEINDIIKEKIINK